MTTELWPVLPLEGWKDTYATLHMWTQIVGKIRLAQTPWVNHSWHVTPIPYGMRTFQIDFDFIDYRLIIQTSDGAVQTIVLRPISVADFYGEVMMALRDLDLGVSIHTRPNEVTEPIPKEFRSRFIGKCSPVHFFWSGFDLAVTRFSGRPAPEHPGGVPNLPDSVTREAYSHTVETGTGPHWSEKQ